MLQALLLKVIEDKAVELVFKRITEKARIHADDPSHEINHEFVDTLIKHKDTLINLPKAKVKKSKKKKKKKKKGYYGDGW